MGRINQNEIARFYDEYHQKRERTAPIWMNEYWAEFKKPVLEIGCGTLIPPIDYLPDYTGLDISIEAGKQIKEKGAMALIGSGLNLPFKDKRFRTVACHDVLEHVLKPEQLLKEVCRVSSERIVIYGPNYVGTNFYRNKIDYVPRIVGVMSRQHHFSLRIKEPHLKYDNSWESDADAVFANNIFWVKERIIENGYKVIRAESFLKKKWLNYIPLVKYIGSFMVVVAERKS